MGFSSARRSGPTSARQAASATFVLRNRAMEPKMRNRRSRSTGSMSVEFAFVTFTLLSVVFAAIEFDRMLLVCTTLANSTRAGLRYAIVHSVDLSGGGIVKN